jgi:hypothetical protein
MYTHPYLAMALANDRADRLRAAALAHRLVRPTKPGQRGTRLSAPLAVCQAS